MSEDQLHKNQRRDQDSINEAAQKNGGKDEGRSQWDNQFQFILTALGLAVGLGNVWKFPSVAYENGGSAFLIPYLLCGLFFGLPMVYAEFTIGQFCRAGPGKALGRYASGFQGVGWSMALLSMIVAVYYCVIIAWSGVYLGWIATGNSYKWTICGNEWNTDYCVSQNDSKKCRPNYTYFFNGSCVGTSNNMVKQPAEEFFVNYVTKRSSGIDTIGGIIWPVAISLVIMWLLATLVLIKGINIIGKMAYVTVPLPYIVVIILFFRGITLNGAWKGVEFYLFKPDWNKLMLPATWGNALTQLMFSMNIGYGGLISLSSYSKFTNNHFRDTLIVIIGDTTMSLIGGIAAFSILGYLSKQLGKPITELIESGTSLAFIVYPEAMSTMPFHYIWEFLFFLMLFFLGVSTEIALIESLTGCVYDVFPQTKKYSWAVTMGICSVGFALGSVMVTHSGWYWFNLYADYAGVTNCLVTAIEVLILSAYGWRNIKQDLAEMRGLPRFKGIARWFGPQSPIFAVFWATICPLLALTVMVITFMKTMDVKIKLGKDAQDNDIFYFFPTWAAVFGWVLNIVQAIPILIFFVYRYIENKKIGRPFHYLFRPNSELTSCKRYYKQLDMTPPDEFGKEDDGNRNNGTHVFTLGI